MDFTHATFQAEIARQVALALQERFSTQAISDQSKVKQTRRRRTASQDRDQQYIQAAKEKTGTHLVMFPGGAR
jgi:hypothetical protein